MKVIILTPTYDGKVDVLYENSLIETILKGQQRGISIKRMGTLGVSTVTLSRDASLKQAYDEEPDAVVWIDSDISWKAEDFFRLLEHSVDIVGAAYRIKCESEEYVIDASQETQENFGDLIKVKGLGLGFFKMSFESIKLLWEVSNSYMHFIGGKRFELKRIFQEKVINDKFIHEDVVLCLKLQALGYTVYLDPTIDVHHVGRYVYRSHLSEKGLMAYSGLMKGRVYGN